MHKPLFIYSVLLLTLTACASLPATGERAAVGDFGEATLNGPSGDRIGSARFRQGPTGLLIRIEAQGLTPGWHGVHLHGVGDCSDSAFQSAGGHVDHAPDAAHGLLNVSGPEAGDLPNIHADSQGRVNAEVFTTSARIARTGPGEMLWDDDGAAIVIHAGPDDHASQPIGGSGARVACGIMAAG